MAKYPTVSSTEHFEAKIQLSAKEQYLHHHIKTATVWIKKEKHLQCDHHTFIIY